MKDEIKEDELIKSNRNFFNYLISLRNRDLRKEIENCNWNAILQLIRYCEYEITNLQEELKGIKSNFDVQLEYDKELENKITNLQKENENLEKINNANYLSFIDANKKRLKAIEYSKNCLDNLTTIDEEEAKPFKCIHNNYLEILNGDNE